MGYYILTSNIKNPDKTKMIKERKDTVGKEKKYKIEYVKKGELFLVRILQFFENKKKFIDIFNKNFLVKDLKDVNKIIKNNKPVRLIITTNKVDNNKNIAKELEKYGLEVIYISKTLNYIIVNIIEKKEIINNVISVIA